MIKKRVILWWMLFCGIVMFSFQSTNINVAIISMVKRSNSIETSNLTTVCGEAGWIQNTSLDKNTTTSESLNSKLDWNLAEQNLILGGYYWLSWAVQLYGGLLSHKYGTKLVFGITIFISTLLSAAVPLLAHYSYKLVLALRVLQGAIASVGFPAAMFPIIGAWAPPDETGKFSALFMGLALGVTFGYPLFGVIVQNLGWEWIFYFTSLSGTVWYIFWLMLVFDSPDNHPRISEEEKLYLKNCQQNRVVREKLPVPWKKIITSIPVLTCVGLNFAQQWALCIFSIYLPSYFKNMFGLGLTQSGFIIGGPFSVRIFVQFLGAAYTDNMVKNGYDETIVRKIAVLIGFIVPGAILCAILLSSCHLWANVGILSAFIIFTALTTSGGQAALMNMSPNFGGAIQGMNFTVSNTAGFISPILFGFLEQSYGPLEVYPYIFFITALLTIITGVMFILFGDSKLQPWNSSQKDDAHEKESVAVPLN